MKKQKSLNFIIIAGIIGLIVIAISVGYEQKMNVEKKVEQDKISKKANAGEIKNNIQESVKESIVENKEEEEEIVQEQEYVGKEENNSLEEDNKEKTKDQKTIDLAKKTWGDDDSVTFSIEEKKGIVYYVAVKSNATVISWYEVNTDTWEISEFY